MEMTDDEKKTLKNIDEKLRWSRKKIKPMLKDNPNKLRRQETADSDEYKEVPES